MSSQTPVSPVSPSPQAAADTQVILGRRILTILAIVSFVLAVLLLAIGTFESSLINTPMSRMCLIALVALALTTFAWVFYPQVVQAQGVQVPFLGWQVTGFGGPLLLFILTLGVLHLLFPNPPPPSHPATRYYTIDYPGDLPPLASFRFDGKKTHARLHPVIDATKQPGDGLIGFVVVFDAPVPFAVKLSNEFGWFKDQKVSFEPGTDNGTITLSK
jgi:hypothetical protein